MNGTEQKNHRTVTAELARAIESVSEGAVVRFARLEKRLQDEGAVLRQQIGDERTHRLKLADEQRAYVDARDRELRESHARLAGDVAAFQSRTFWQRLRWLVRGA